MVKPMEEEKKEEEQVSEDQRALENYKFYSNDSTMTIEKMQSDNIDMKGFASWHSNPKF